MTPATRHWAVVPAAGVGRRMGGETPKQYLPLAGRTVIERALRRLLESPRVEAVYVAVSPDDRYWDASAYARHPRVVRVTGGAERCHSVLNALDALAALAAADDWVLVHDAARPCLRAEDLERLMDRLRGHPVGGLLGVPVHDTMKRVDRRGLVSETVAREGLWHALTPQMFRLGALRRALRRTLDGGLLVSDDAGAMEAAGAAPLMVEGSPDNIKITRPADLALAAFYLMRQEQPRK